MDKKVAKRIDFHKKALEKHKNKIPSKRSYEMVLKRLVTEMERFKKTYASNKEVLDECDKIVNEFQEFQKNVIEFNLAESFKKAQAKIEKNWISHGKAKNKRPYVSQIERTLNLLEKDNEVKTSIHDEVVNFIQSNLQKLHQGEDSEPSAPSLEAPKKRVNKKSTTRTKKANPKTTTSNAKEEKSKERVRKLLEKQEKGCEQQFKNALKNAEKNLSSAKRALTQISTKLESLKKEIAKNPYYVEEVNKFIEETEKRVIETEKIIENKNKFASLSKEFADSSKKVFALMKSLPTYVNKGKRFLSGYNQTQEEFQNVVEIGNEKFEQLEEYKAFKKDIPRKLDELGTEFLKQLKLEDFERFKKLVFSNLKFSQSYFGQQRGEELFFKQEFLKAFISSEYKKDFPKEFEEFEEKYSEEHEKFESNYQEAFNSSFDHFKNSKKKRNTSDVFGNIYPTKLEMKKIDVSLKIESILLPSVIKFNNIAEDLKIEEKSILRLLETIDLFNYKEETIAKVCSRIISKIDKLFVDLGRALPKKKEEKETETGKFMMNEEKRIKKEYETTRNAWERVEEIQIKLLEVDYFLKITKDLVAGGKGCRQGTYPNAASDFHLHSHLIGMFNNIDSEFKRKIESNEAFCDYNIFLFAYDLCIEVIKYIKSTEKKFSKFPTSRISDFEAVSVEAKKLHTEHCIKAFLGVSQKHKKHYIKSLARFPIARQFCKKQLKQLKYDCYERDMHRFLDAKNFIFSDPNAGKTVPNSFKESMDDYDFSYELIRPADPKLPVLDRPEDCKTRKWNSLKKKYTGKLVFSKSLIDVDESSDKAFSNSFVYGKDEIYGRAYWSHAVYNYPIAKDKKTGKLLYPAEELKGIKAEFLFLVYIDGKKQIVKQNPFGEAVSFQERYGSRDDQPNFYSKSQSCRFFVQKKKVNIFDDYETGAQRFSYFFSKLKPGKHSVKIDLCYRIISGSGNISLIKPTFPEQNTYLSYPIASGEFTISIPKGAKLPNPISSTDSNVDNLKKIEKEVARVCGEYSEKEIYVCSSLHGDLYPASHITLYTKDGRTYQKLVRQWGLNVNVLYYRDPRKGWDNEHCRYFKKSCYTHQYQKQEAPRSMPPIQNGLGVGGSVVIDADLIPNEVFKKAGVKRCSKNDADKWYTDLSKEDRSHMNREF